MGSPSHISGNILDLLLTNNEDLIQNITVYPYEASPIPTDHLMISFQLSLGTCLLNKTHPHVTVQITHNLNGPRMSLTRV